jgi:hypothetical protein
LLSHEHAGSDVATGGDKRPGADRLLEKCEELLDILYAHEDHAKLRLLIADIEALRDRRLDELDGPSSAPRSA